jgi:uncharacterized protein YndB with AHSA1/START domain
MPDIMHQLTIAATRAAIYPLLTEQRGLAAWWTTDVVAKPRVGSVAKFGFGARDTVIRMRIEELVPGSRIRWQCVGGIGEWEHTQVTFDLQAKGRLTVLQFRHLGWRSTEGALALCSFDWAHYLMSLRSLAETGVGNPHQARLEARR